ncbi:unnamed protein product, partial [Heterobilharzia americana]
EPPHFTKKPNPVEFVRNGVPTILHCQANGQPKPTIFWFYSQSNNQEGEWPSFDVLSALDDQKKIDKMVVKSIDDEDEEINDEEDLGKGSEYSWNDTFYITDKYIKHILEKYRITTKRKSISNSLPNGVDKLPDGNLHIFTENVSKITGKYFCVAENLIGRIMTLVELKQNFTTRLLSQTDNTIVLNVKPFIYSAVLSWKFEQQLSTFNLLNYVNTVNSQCYYITYHLSVRSDEDWIATVVHQEHINRIRITGLLPNELYAFRIIHWCNPLNHSYSSSSTVLIKTSVPLKRGPESILRFPRPSAPYSLRLQIIQAEKHESILTWKVQDNLQFSTAELTSQQVKNIRSAPILYFQVEFTFCTYINPHLYEVTNCSDRGNHFYTWESLAPIRYPKFVFEMNNNNKVLELTDVMNLYDNINYSTEDDSIKIAIEHIHHASRLTNSLYYSSIYELRFRIRSFSLMSVSEPSNELIIKHPLLPSVLNALNQTLQHEHYLIYKIIHQIKHESIHRHSQHDSSILLNSSKCKMLQNNTVLFDNTYLRYKQIQMNCCSVIICCLIPRKIYRQCKQNSLKQKQINTDTISTLPEYPLVSNSNHLPRKHLVSYTSNENVFNNHCQINDTTFLSCSPNYLWTNSEYIVNKIQEKRRPDIVNTCDTCIIHSYYKNNDEDTHQYTKQLCDEKNSFHTVVNSPMVCLTKSVDESCGQIYFLLPTYNSDNNNNNMECSSPNTLCNQQMNIIQHPNVHNSWNRKEIRDGIDEHSKGNNRVALMPTLLRADHFNSTEQSLTKNF